LAETAIKIPAANISVLHQQIINVRELSMFKVVNARLSGRNLWYFLDPGDSWPILW